MILDPTYKIRIFEDGWKSGFGAFVGWNSSNSDISRVSPNCLFAKAVCSGLLYIPLTRKVEQRSLLACGTQKGRELLYIL